MKLEYDPVKGQLNLNKHGVSLARFVDLDWDNASITNDNRKSYGETRYIAVAELEDRLHITCLLCAAAYSASLAYAGKPT